MVQLEMIGANTKILKNGVTTNMKRIHLLVLPILLVLSNCSSLPSKANYFVEDTNVHEEIFGSLNSIKSKIHKLNSYKSLSEGETLYKPSIGFQRKTNNDGTFSVRFVAAMQSATDSAFWTRSVHDLDGQIAKTKKIKNVSTVYDALNNEGNPLYATSVTTEDGIKPYDCYAIYCLLNIPSSYSDYYVDAFLTVKEGEEEITSDVGSLNVSDSSKHIKYALNGDRYGLDINGDVRESDNLQDGNHLNNFSIDLSSNDYINALYLDNENLNYARYDYLDIVRENPDFQSGSNNEIIVKHAGTYNIFLNNINKISFEKKIYFQGPEWWTNNSAQGGIEGKHNEEYKSFNMDYIKYSEGVHKYSAFMDISYYNEVQFYRQETNRYNHTGFMNFPIDGKNCYTRYSNEHGGAWTIYGDEVPTYPDGGFIINDLTEPAEIHTSAQKSYLEYTGDYSLMISGVPDAQSNSSGSNPVTITFDYTAPNGKTVSKYSIVSGKESDLSDGYQVDGNTNKSISFLNPYLGRNYYKLIANFTDNTTEESSIHYFDVDSTCPRNLTIDGITNCRDMGGRLLEDGGTFKQGLIYRTSGNSFKPDGSSTTYTISNSGKLEMINHLKVKTEINLAETKYALSLSGTTVKDMYMTPSNGINHFSRNAELVKDFFEILADSNNYPIFYHCKIGTDRTGLCAILLNGLLGVSLNDIYQDYMFSNFGHIGEQRVIANPSQERHDIRTYIGDINKVSGTTFKNKVYNCLLSIGLSKKTLKAVIYNLTDGALAQNDTNQVVADATSLNSNGVSITHQTSSTIVPEYYYTLNSASKSVSYTFDAEEDYKGQIVAYLGSNSSSNSSKAINQVISCKLDSSNVDIANTTTCSNAGLYYGSSSSSGTIIHYYFVILGEVNISKGQHTISIVGTSNAMNVACLSILSVSN